MSENLDLIFGIELKQSTKEVEESLLIKRKNGNKSHNCMFTSSKDSIDLHCLIIFKKNRSFLLNIFLNLHTDLFRIITYRMKKATLYV